MNQGLKHTSSKQVGQWLTVADGADSDRRTVLRVFACAIHDV